MYNPLNEVVDGLRNRVIRRESTKARAFEKLSETLEAMDSLFIKLREFYAKEPGEGAS